MGGVSLKPSRVGAGLHPLQADHLRSHGLEGGVARAAEDLEQRAAAHLAAEVLDRVPVRVGRARSPAGRSGFSGVTVPVSKPTGLSRS